MALSINLRFELRYLLGDTPWDSGVSPPELHNFLESNPAGRAIEFGCGTGTNAITLAQHGWRVDAIDLSWVAIKRAQRKASRANLEINIVRADVTHAIQLPSVTPPYDFGLDIGCFHALDPKSRADYAQQLPRLIGAGGTYLLYSFLNTDSSDPHQWPAESAIIDYHQPNFEVAQVEHGSFHERASAWFKFRRKS